MKTVMTTILCTLFLLGCTSVPAPGSAAFFDADLSDANNLILEKIEVNTGQERDNLSSLTHDMCIQAAGANSFRLTDPGVTDTGLEKTIPRLSLILSEREYSLDLENWNSVAVRLRLSEPAMQLLVTEDTHFSFKSAGYLYGLLDRLFAQLRERLGHSGKRP